MCDGIMSARVITLARVIIQDLLQPHCWLSTSWRRLYREYWSLSCSTCMRFYDRVYVHVINTLRPRQISLLRGRADFGELHLSKREKGKFRPHKSNNILALSGAVNNCIHANNTPFGFSLRGGGGRCWGLNCYVKARQIGLSRHA